MYHLFSLLLLLPLLAVAVPAPQASLSSASTTAAAGSATTVPYYSAPNTFTPTASGSEPLAGSLITLTNTAGPGSVTDSFIYTAALSTVAPTGSVTVKGSATGQSDLQPDPTNLQTAAAHRLSLSLSLPNLGGGIALTLGAIVGGIMLGGWAV